MFKRTKNNKINNNNIGRNNNYNDNFDKEIGELHTYNYQNINENEDNYEDNNNNEEDEEEDDRLTYTLITLDLGNLIRIFEENNISFIDMLLLTKEDLKELQLSLYQRNRIYHFSLLFNKYAKNYSIGEISDFFSFNKQFIFNSSIYDRVNSNDSQNIYDNINEFRNNAYYYTNNNNNYNRDENQIDNTINYNEPKNNLQNFSNGATNNNNFDINNIYNQNNSMNIINNKKYKNITSNSNINNNNIQNKKEIKNNNINQNCNSYNNHYSNNIIKKENNTENNNEIYKRYNLNKNKEKEKSDKKKGKKVSSLIIKDKDLSFQNYQYKNKIDNNEEFKENKNENNKKEYEKMLKKIDEIEQMKMDYNSYNHLNQIKDYIKNKGEYITIEDMNRVIGEIDIMIEILNEREKLKNALENCNMKIEEKKKMINNIEKKEEKEEDEKGEDNKEINNENVNEYVNIKYIDDIEIYNKDNDKNVEEVVEVEEEYDNDSQHKKQ